MDLAGSIFTNAGQTIGLSEGILVFIWLALVILFIIIEMVSLGLTSIWFAGGALISALSAILGAPIWLQVVLFILVSGVLLASTRGLSKTFLEKRLEKTNAEGLIGKTSTVVETIDNASATGKIRLGDVEWTARACNESQVIEKDTKVIIREIKGVKCMVEPLSAQEKEILYKYKLSETRYRKMEVLKWEELI